MRSIDTYNIHRESRKWLETSLEESKGFKNVVITHHAPSIKSVPQEYLNNPVTAAYASNLEDLIVKYKPLYWIHGHIHAPARYFIDTTEVICNPHGYLVEKYNGHDKELILDV